MTYRSACITVLLAGFALALALPASAHDDGLTCHSHGKVLKDRLWFFASATTNVEADAVKHNFENLLAAEGSGFTSADLSAARRGLTEFEEMVEVVYLLVVRAERMGDQGMAAIALELARSVFEELPIARHTEFGSFLSENRFADGVVLKIEVVSAFLRNELGVPADLADVVERAAESC